MKNIKWQYTIGEIIIVMIGISLAFSLNNYKENIQNRKFQDQYLENMLLDLEQEKIQLENNNQSIQKKLQQIKDLRPHLGKTLPRRDTVIRKFFDIAQSVQFNPENTTYQTLINSGDMKLINDFNLRRNIEAHYNGHQEVKDQYTRLENIYTKYMADFFVYDVDFEALRQGDFSFLDHFKVKGILNSLDGSFNFAYTANEKCLESNQKLVDAIQAIL